MRAAGIDLPPSFFGERMLVHNESTSVHVVPVDTKGNTRRCVTLMPGVNDVADGDWEKMQEIKIIKIYREEGSLRELDATPISKRSPKDAVRVVKDTYDRGLLLKWREDDKRPQVQDAIGAQLKGITPTAEELGKGKEKS
jgi:hypothetical protein